MAKKFDTTNSEIVSAAEIAETAAMLQNAEFPQHPEIENEAVAPSAEAVKKAFNVYVSTLPRSEGQIFSIMYFNPAHTTYVSAEEVANGAKDEKVLRFWGNDAGSFYRGKAALGALQAFLRNKFVEQGAGWVRRYNGNLVISGDFLATNMVQVRGARGVYVLKGLGDKPLRLVGPMNTSNLRMQPWVEYELLSQAVEGSEFGDTLQFKSALNARQIVHFEYEQKFAAGWNFYFRKLDGSAYRSDAMLQAMKAETRAKYVRCQRYFFHQPLIRAIVASIEDSREDAVVNQEVSDKMGAAMQHRAVSSTASRIVREATESGDVTAISVVDGDKLLVDPKWVETAKGKHADWLVTDDKGVVSIDLSKVNVTTQFIGLNRKTGMRVESRTLMFSGNADADVKVNARTIAILKANATSLFWRF